MSLAVYALLQPLYDFSAVTTPALPDCEQMKTDNAVICLPILSTLQRWRIQVLSNFLLISNRDLSNMGSVLDNN